MSVDLTKFDAVDAAIAKLKEDNDTAVFDYHSEVGNKAALSHIYKLRQVKTVIAKVHKVVKEDVLRVSQAIDLKKRTLIASLDTLIEVHAAPLREIEEKAEAERLAEEAAKEKAEREAEEKRQADLAVREAEIEKREADHKAKEAAFNAEQEKAKRVEREKQIAEESAEKARKEEQAEQERKRKEAEAERERLAEIERKRVENQEHRTRIETAIYQQLHAIIEDPGQTKLVWIAICEGKINHITINY